MAFELVPVALAAANNSTIKDLLDTGPGGPKEVVETGKRGISLVKLGVLIIAVIYIFAGIGYYMLKGERENPKEMLVKGFVGLILLELVTYIILYILTGGG